MEKEAIKELTNKLEKGLEELFASGDFKKYLKFARNFHSYSWNNTLLIMLQCPHASHVAGYKTWQKMGRQVKKGEKGIKIFAPYTVKVDSSEIDENGEPKRESLLLYKPISVFDVSQTDGEEIPTLGVDELNGEVKDFDQLIAFFTSLAPCPVFFEAVDGEAKGYFSPSGNKIVVKKDMAQLQTIKTLIHELTHSLLHGKECLVDGVDGTKSRSLRELEAESVAFIVCDYMGFDTSEYSFGYIAGWSASYSIKDLKQVMGNISKTANTIISALENKAEVPEVIAA